LKWTCSSEKRFLGLRLGITKAGSARAGAILLEYRVVFMASY